MTVLFVAGHSDSDDRFLPAGISPWPERTRAWLETTSGREFELKTRRFAPMGSKAVGYILGAIEAARPEIVVLPIGAYACTVGVVSESVRQRFGPRAQRIYSRAESAFQAQTSEGRLRLAANRRARQAGRRLFGVRTLATVESVGDIYDEVLRGLARIETLQVVAVADARFSLEVQERCPGLHATFDKLHARIRPVVEQHHFAWADLEAELSRAADRAVFHTADGVHTTAAFHDVYFQLLTRTLAETPTFASPL